MAARKNAASAPTIDADSAAPAADAGGRYVGQWNRLVSTTNWEKGRIICQWRDALVAADEPASAYSDEAWSQLVGGVTSQHVGRLRRVYQRFGDSFDQYEGLYWSHFQAAIDWEDAEMWLEGALQKDWSVSQMRGKRWETLGRPGEEPPADDAAETGEIDDDSTGEAPFDDDEAGESGATAAVAEKSAKQSPDRDADEVDDDSAESAEHASSESSSPAAPAKARTRLAVDVDDLPEDLADAFEQFKLAIIAQRRLDWSETTPEAVIACLDALRELTLAPADG